MSKSTPGAWVIHLAQRVSIRPVNSDTELARLFGPYARAETNARLIVAATNAAKEINPEAPHIAAENLLNLFNTLNEVANAIGHLRDGDTMRAATVERIAREALDKAQAKE